MNLSIQFTDRGALKVLCSAFFLLLALATSAQTSADTDEINVFPNPSDGFFTISTTGPISDIEYLIMTDLKGRLVHGFTLKTEPNAIHVNFIHHPEGFYIGTLIYKDGSSQQFRVEKY